MSDEEEWSRNNQPFLNQYTNVILVKGLDHIRGLLDSPDVVRVVPIISNFILFLDPDIKDKLKDERRILKEMEEGSSVRNVATIREIMDKISDALFRADYFTMAKGLKPLNPRPRGLGKDNGEQ